MGQNQESKFTLFDRRRISEFDQSGDVSICTRTQSVSLIGYDLRIGSDFEVSRIFVLLTQSIAH